MFSTSLLLLLAAASCVHCSELTQPDSMVVRPGESLTINCKVSYSVTDYNTHWIRQPAGKALEWVGYISWDSSGSTAYSDKLKSKFSISRNTGTNTITLQGQNLQTEDTAVYYCARLYSNAFDYWGKGTSVTVSSGGSTAPTSLFAVSQCAPSSDGLLTLGCVTSGFSPADSLKFKWTGDVSDVVQYPAVQQGGSYTVVSHARVKAADWDAKKVFTCQAEHPGSSTPIMAEIVNTPKVVHVQAPTLLLAIPTQAELDNGTATFICIASQYSPKGGEFTWTLDNTKISDRARPTILNEEKSTFTSISILNITADEWTGTVSPIKCEFKHQDKKYFKEAKSDSYITEDCEQEKINIIPPSTEDMLVRKVGELRCSGQGRKGFNRISWSANGKVITSTYEGEVGGASLTAITKISYEDWSKGTEYTCTVEHKLFAALTKEITYKRENGQIKKCPSVYLLAPPESVQEEFVTLTCYVKDFYPKEVVVYWLANDEKLNDTEGVYQQRTSCPIETENERYSVYSQLVVTAAEWESGVVYSCLVYQEAINPTIRMISRSIDNVSKKPTLLNLSMSVPSNPACVAS